jgi:hypothetical protein
MLSRYFKVESSQIVPCGVLLNPAHLLVGRIEWYLGLVRTHKVR